MKKLFVIFVSASLMLTAANANAQSLSTILKGAASQAISSATGTSQSTANSILNGVSNLVYAYTGATNTVSLPGSWSYNGSAISLDGSSTVATLAGTAVSTSAESKINGALEKFGLTNGSISFVFNEDLTFTCNFKGLPLNGRWKTLNDGATVQLQFGQNLKYLSMTGDLKNSATGCQMLFKANKFLSFLKAAAALAGQSSSTIGAVAGLSDNYTGMKMGFNLTKTK